MKYAALLVALSGCDLLFDLDHLSANGDGGAGDGGSTDSVAADALMCTPVGHDEDTDNLDDACDLCPTIASSGSPDTDLDGLPDACDRDNAPTRSDKILAYWTFPMQGFDGFVTAGNFSYMQVNNGMVGVGGSSSVTTTLSYPLTRVDFHVSGITMADFNSQLQLQIGTQTLCTMRGASCGGSGTGTCIQFGGTAMGTWPMPSSAARRVSLFRDADTVKCEITDGTNPNSVGATTSLPAGSVGFATTATTSLKLEAIVIYGET